MVWYWYGTVPSNSNRYYLETKNIFKLESHVECRQKRKIAQWRHPKASNIKLNRIMVRWSQNDSIQSFFSKNVTGTVPYLTIQMPTKIINDIFQYGNNYSVKSLEEMFSNSFFTSFTSFK